ncbi:unnamed protein product, partial [Ixodes pacificus]
IPEIRPFAFPPNLRVGEKALITCHVTSGSQPITFSWLKDGHSMEANQGIRLKSEPEFSFILMEPVQPSHVGNYTCIAKNKHGFDSFTAVLEVESAPTWKALTSDKTVVWNKTLHLECPAVGYPQPQLSFKKKAVPKLQLFNFPPTVKPGSRVSAMCSTTSGGSQVALSWLKDGKDIANLKNVLVDTKQGTSVIIVEPVEISNAGNYTCIAKNREGFDSFTVSLDVQAPPSWKKKPEDVRVNIGDRAVIECFAIGSPAPQVKWRKQLKGLSTILIEPVEIFNSGNYTCIAKNRAGFDSFTVFLDVQAPPSWKRRAEDVRVSIGDRAKFECLATGSPTPKIRWRKRTQGEEIYLAPSSNVKIYDNGTLIVEDVTTNDGGDYSCEADNGMPPSATITFSVTVNVSAEVPRLQPFTFPSDVKPGSRVSTLCLTSSGGSEVALSWLKDGRDVGDTKNVFVETNKGLSTILIEPVDISNAGNYTCIAKNRAGFD